MKILLINPNSRRVHTNLVYPIAPLGVAYIAAVLEKNGQEVAICDQFANKISDNRLLSHIKTAKPSVVGFSALSTSMLSVKKLAMAIRKMADGTKIILGNIEASYFSDEILKDGWADIVVRDEGEIAMLEICQCIEQKKGLDDIKGISFKRDEEIIHNPDRELFGDLDALPLPAWHLLNLDDYTEFPLAGTAMARTLPIAASRGCAYCCYYCSQDKNYNKIRFRDLKRVVDEMEYFNGKFKIKFFGFNDAYFPNDEESGLQFCELVIKRNLQKKCKWCTETRVDKVTPRLLKAMKEAGVHLVMYGIEVGNPEILKSLNKGTTLEEARIALKETRKVGIMSLGFFILGLPGETKETCIETIDFARELKCDIAKFNLAIPYPNSRFFEDYKKIEKERVLKLFNSWFDWLNLSEDLVFTPKGMDIETLRYLQRRAILGFYLRKTGAIFKDIAKGKIICRNIFYGGLLFSLFLYSLVKKQIRSILAFNKFK